jgi:YidC/Oxa1 family membrane protein insertase
MPELKNPQQDPSDFQRLLLVFALTFIAIAASQFFLSKFGPRPTPKPEDKSSQQQQVTAPTANPPAPNLSTAQGNATTVGAPPARSSQVGERERGKTPANSTKPSTAPAPVVTKQAASESTTIVENDLYKITFTNKGAQVKSWILKKHTDDAGHPLDLVNARAAEAYGYPLSLFTYDAALRTTLNSALFEVVSPETSMKSVTFAPDKLPIYSAKAPATINFEYSDGDITARKTFRFDHDYTIKIETSVQVHGQEVAAFPAWPSGFGDQNTAPAWAAAHVDWYSGDKVERHAAHEGSFYTSKTIMANGATVPGPFHWAGVVDQYFAAIFLPDQPADAALVELHDVIPQNPNENDAAKRKSEVFSVLGTAVGSLKGPTSERLFVGPKALDVLESVRSYSVGADVKTTPIPAGPALSPIVDFGMFSFIAKPLFLWLNWTHDHWIQNWGWAICLLTIIINLALFPLRYTGMKSALLQQKIAPELKAINKRYEGLKLTDPRQHDKQKEVAEVMKRENINQFAGCLPTIIQFPFLIAFYTMLSTVNELRNAHWLWIHDLSSPDPWHLLPITIVVTMFLMQRATPMAGVDPAQAKMMQVMMPLMFGGISWSLPAGLGVYWVTGNLIGWGLQYVMNNTPMAREIRAHLNKRAAKKSK